MPYLVIAGACVITGGLISAATAHAPSQKGSWAAAYLVLVGGVAQIGLALGAVLLRSRPLTTVRLALELTAWNLGNAAVLAGTLVDITWLVDVGGALLVVALALAAWNVRRDGGQRGLRYAFVALVVLLLVSIPVGLLLARS